jgi:signal transduction histidine kinase
MSTFRARVLALVLAVALPPLFIIGVWLTRTVTGSGDRALAQTLEDIAETSTSHMVHAWASTRYDILNLAESPLVERVLSQSPATAADRTALDALAAQLDRAVQSLTLRSNTDSIIWRSGTDNTTSGILYVDMPIHQSGSLQRTGTLTAGVRFDALLFGQDLQLPPGAVVSGVDPRTHASLLALPFDPPLARARRFTSNGQVWIAHSRPVADPRVEILVAAPRTPYIASLQAATRQGVWLLVLLGVAGAAAAWILAGRLTRTLHTLAGAAGSVAEGDLERRVPVEGSRELRTLASAFNRMTDNLKATLRALSEREALAAVGEFATELAHEVRNPLTAIKLDLQYVQERLAADSPLHEVQGSALAEIQRLDVTVNSTLLLARSGRLVFDSIDVREPLRAACRMAQPAFDHAHVVLDTPDITRYTQNETVIHGDAVALERLFLNLLLNAAEASGPRTRTAVYATTTATDVIVHIDDAGSGIPAGDADSIFDAHYTTRRTGTGLGLTIARRIAHAHHGAIELESMPGQGAHFRVRIPRFAETAVTVRDNVPANDARSPVTG